MEGLFDLPPPPTLETARRRGKAHSVALRYFANMSSDLTQDQMFDLHRAKVKKAVFAENVFFCNKFWLSRGSTFILPASCFSCREASIELYLTLKGDLKVMTLATWRGVTGRNIPTQDVKSSCNPMFENVLNSFRPRETPFIFLPLTCNGEVAKLIRP